MNMKKLNRVYHGMKERCYYANNKEYKNYGGRGISVCKEWEDFPSFAKWAYENGYDDSLTIDRIDNNGNYEPDNCRWIPLNEQGKNTTRTVNITVCGISMGKLKRPMQTW